MSYNIHLNQIGNTMIDQTEVQNAIQSVRDVIFSFPFNGIVYQVTAIVHNESYGNNYNFMVHPHFEPGHHAYGDRKVQKHFNAALKGFDVEWSENGMQTKSLVNFDIVPEKATSTFPPLEDDIKTFTDFLTSYEFEIINEMSDKIVAKKKRKGTISIERSVNADGDEYYVARKLTNGCYWCAIVNSVDLQVVFDYLTSRKYVNIISKK